MKELVGTFDGQYMIDADGEKYPVPANYASKSKLIEGDGLKLNIEDNDEFVFKLVNPIHRIRVIKEIQEDNEGLFILHNTLRYKMNPCAIKYYKLQAGSKVIAIIPKFIEDTEWCAIEGVITR